jgi:hypothetical protein
MNTHNTERLNEEGESRKTYIADATAIQLETAVTKAAEEVERCEAAQATAEEKVDQIERRLVDVEADLQEAEEARRKLACERLGVYWTLGRAITDLETALVANKGKHSTNTPRKRAIELAGNNARYQRAKAISSHFDCRDDAEKAAVVQSFNDILKQIAEKKSEDRKAKGQEAPGRKPEKNPKVATSVNRKAPVPQEDEVATDDVSVAEEEETEVEPSSITAEEMEAVKIFVASVGGWNRATYLMKEVYQKWLQNQTN